MPNDPLIRNSPWPAVDWDGSGIIDSVVGSCAGEAAHGNPRMIRRNTQKHRKSARRISGTTTPPNVHLVESIVSSGEVVRGAEGRFSMFAVGSKLRQVLFSRPE